MNLIMTSVDILTSIISVILADFCMHVSGIERL